MALQYPRYPSATPFMPYLGGSDGRYPWGDDEPLDAATIQAMAATAGLRLPPLGGVPIHEAEAAWDAAVARKPAGEG